MFQRSAADGRQRKGEGSNRNNIGQEEDDDGFQNQPTIEEVNSDDDIQSLREQLNSFELPSSIYLKLDNKEYSELYKSIRKEDLGVLVKTVNNLTRMHEALELLNDDSRSLEEKQIAVMTQNSHGVTALFWAVRRNADFQLIEKMVEIGGKEAVLIVNKSQENVLHQCAFLGVPYEVFALIIDAGGKDMLLQRDKFGNTPLHYGM